MIGTLLDGRYLVTKILSQGGFSKTFVAQDTKRPGNPICVVKKLHPLVSYPPNSFEIIQGKFYQEAETLEKLGEHRQIPRLLAYFQENEEFYLVQEYIDGYTLDSEIKPGHRLPEKQVIQIILELLEILKFVHSHNVIHRDIKPQNIIRRKEDNKLFLIDFGAVKQVTSGGQPSVVIGTPPYMPIEQLGGNPSFRSDLYALGIVCIQALTGVNLDPVLGSGFAKDEQGEIIWRDGVQVSDRLANILTKMTRKEEKERYSSVEETLEAVQNTSPIAGDTVISSPIPKKKLWVYLLIGLIFISVIAAILYRLKDTFLIYPPPINGEVKGVFESKDKNSLNIYSRQYTLVGRKGQTVTIEMDSNELDSSLVLLNPKGNQIGVNDDVSPDNFNAKITTTLPEDGNYIVVARSSQPGELGSYSLKAIVK